MKKILFVKKKKPFSLKCTLLQNVLHSRSQSWPLRSPPPPLPTPPPLRSQPTLRSPPDLRTPRFIYQSWCSIQRFIGASYFYMIHAIFPLSKTINFWFVFFFGKNPNFCNFTSISSSMWLSSNPSHVTNLIVKLIWIRINWFEL